METKRIAALCTVLLIASSSSVGMCQVGSLAQALGSAVEGAIGSASTETRQNTTTSNPLQALTNAATDAATNAATNAVTNAISNTVGSLTGGLNNQVQERLGLGTPFCQIVSNKLTDCPTPPTVRNLNMTKFEGKWYGVAINAQAALGGDLLGTQCLSQQFGPAARVASGETKLALATKKQEVIGPLSQARVRVISTSANALGLGMRSMCRSIMGGSSSVDSMSLAIRVSAMGSTKNQDAASAIRTNIRAASKAAEVIFNALDRIVQRTAYMDGVALPAPVDIGPIQGGIIKDSQAISLEISKLQKCREAVVGAAQTLAQSASNTLVSASANQIAAAASSSGQWARAIQAMEIGNRALRASAQVLETSNVLALGNLLVGRTNQSPDSGVVSILNAITGYNFNVSGRGIFATAAQVAGAVLGGSYKKSNNNIVLRDSHKAVAVSFGRAQLNNSQSGIIDVAYPGGSKTSFWVLKVYSANEQYQGALIYSCSNTLSSGGQPQNSIVLLSRKPVLSKAAILRAHKEAESLGVMLGGENPLVAVAQSKPMCRT